MNNEYIIFSIVILILLLYLLCRNSSKEKQNTNIYNPFVITKNQTRRITDILNNKMEKNMDDTEWISDDLVVKKCYNSCKGKYRDDYVRCIQKCNKYETFNY